MYHLQKESAERSPAARIHSVRAAPSNAKSNQVEGAPRVPPPLVRRGGGTGEAKPHAPASIAYMQTSIAFGPHSMLCVYANPTRSSSFFEFSCPSPCPATILGSLIVSNP